MSFLDELVFVPGKMSPLSPSAPLSSASVVFGPRGGARPVQAQAPWIVGQTLPQQAGSQWVDLCTRLSQRGLVLDCPAAALEKVPVSSIPRRLFQQRVNTALDMPNLQSADIVEVTCQSALQSTWGWPPEIETTSNLSNWLSAIRRVIGSQTPIGLGLNVGCDDQAIQSACDAETDFLTLHASSSIELLAETLGRLRAQRTQATRNLTIIVRTSSKSIEYLLKILALGASAVTIDGYLSDLWQASGNSMSSFLGTRIPTATPSGPCPIAERIDSLQQKLSELMASTASNNTNDLGQSLRALTPRASQIAALPMLGASST